MSAAAVIADLKALADPIKAEHARGFFKTGPGEYGEGDKFLGVRVPEQRKIAVAYKNMPLAGIKKLLISEWHEVRLTALFILVRQYKKSNEDVQEALFQLYISHTASINNWDLVDSSAHLIVGPHVARRDRSTLDELAESASVWERRIAIVATYHLIKEGDFEDAFRIAERLLVDAHDLIHKAVGWMLREIGKRDRNAEEAFLQKHYRTMPRAMLRYAVERFPQPLRMDYLMGRA